MFAQLVSTYHLHPIVDHFTIALLSFGIAAELLCRRGDPAFSRTAGRCIELWAKAQERFSHVDDRRSGRQRPVVFQW